MSEPAYNPDPAGWAQGEPGKVIPLPTREHVADPVTGGRFPADWVVTEERIAAFLSRFAEGDGCWEWQRCRHSNGYGHFSIRRLSKGQYAPVLAHRFAYMLFVGPIPEGLTIDHLCRNRACVNPAHLEPCTRGENTLRGRTITAENRAKTHCKHGHEFTPENTGYEADGSRICKACRQRVTDNVSARKRAESAQRREAQVAAIRERAAEAERLRAQGLSYQKIADQMGVGYYAVWSWLNNGIKAVREAA